MSRPATTEVSSPDASVPNGAPRADPSVSRANPSSLPAAQSPVDATIRERNHLDREKSASHREKYGSTSDQSRWASRESILKASLDGDGRPEWLRKSKASNAEIAENLEAARQEMLKISEIVMASYPKNG